MKNIHVLPTDKPTWLHKSILTGILRKSSSCIDDMKQAQGMNIYITSDDEIKEGDWIYNLKTNRVDKAKFSLNLKSISKLNWRKIILTTDLELQKDGVQAIDDDFLEWFVKNPSCEEVETKLVEQRSHLTLNDWVDKDENGRFPVSIAGAFCYRKIYKIIIPKEEQTLANMKCTCRMFEANCFTGSCRKCGFPPKEEPKPFKQMDKLTEVEWSKFKKNPIPSKKEEPKKIYDLPLAVNNVTMSCTSKPKKETLEEAALEFAKDHHEMYETNNLGAMHFGFCWGAKWQQERSYSEEDLEKAYKDGGRNEYDFINKYHCKARISFDKWFEQFKKK